MIHFITEQSKVTPLLPIFMSKPAWGIDTETTGLDPFTSKVVLLQIGTNDDQYIIDTRKVSIEPLRPFLESRTIKKIGHNLKFDYKMIKSSFNIEIENLRDTYLAEKLMGVGIKFRGFGLDDVTLERLQVFVDKSLQKSFIGHQGDFTQAQVGYAALDVKDLHALSLHQCQDMERRGLVDVWMLECQVIPAFGDMELGGIKLDVNQWTTLIAENQAKADAIKLQMDEIAKNFFPTDMFGDIYINYGSPKQSLEFLQRMGIKYQSRNPITGEDTEIPLPDTSDKTLRMLKKYPIVNMLQDYRSYLMLINTFGQSFIDAIHPKTGRIHPDFEQLGCETGRISKGHSPVNLLNIPREKKFRQSFVAESNELIETHDYSGCELRILAELSQDPKLCEAFRTGQDVHCYVASVLYNKEVTKKNENAYLRTPAKSLNFGIAYGMKAKSLYERVVAEGFKTTLEEMKGLFRKYNQEFATAIKFLRDNGTLAVKQGYLQNATGRIRNWNIPNPDDVVKYPGGKENPIYQARMAAIENEGGNFLIQSVNADLTKKAMIYIRDYKKQYNVRTELVNQVYDEIVTRTEISESEVFSKIKSQLMIDAGSNWIKSIPVEVDANVCTHWTK
jgi:DNA polymerase-1